MKTINSVGPVKCLALHVEHNVIKKRINLPGFVQREDVRMREIGRNFDLLEELLSA